MIMPIRCMTCGKPVAHLWETYTKGVRSGKNPKNLMDSLGLERYCCRSLFLTHKDMIETIGKFKK